jgi:hypothetical protein
VQQSETRVCENCGGIPAAPLRSAMVLRVVQSAPALSSTLSILAASSRSEIKRSLTNERETEMKVRLPSLKAFATTPAALPRRPHLGAPHHVCACDLEATSLEYPVAIEVKAIEPPGPVR